MVSQEQRTGLFAPVIAVVLALGGAALVLGHFADSRADELTRWRATTAVHALAEAPDPQLDLAALKVEFARVVADDRADRRYPFLRKLSYAAHLTRRGAALDPARDEDKASADAFARHEPTSFRADGGVRAAEVRSDGAVAIVDVAATQVTVNWGVLLLGAVVGCGLWLLVLWRRTPAAWRSPVGALLGATGLLVPIGYTFSTIEAGLSTAFGAIPAATGVALLFAAPLLPLVVFGAVGFSTQSRRSAHRAAYTYVLPAMLGMLVLILVPFALGVVLGFMRHDHGTFTWVGLDNYITILKSEGYGITHPLSFYFTLAVTVLWTAVNVFLHVAIGLGLALILRSPTLRLKGIYRVLLIVPWAVPSYITALVWKGMFNKQYGLINYMLSTVGVEAISWFTNFWTAFTANLTTNTWLGFPFMMLVSLGALQSIPRGLYEAAEVDGASKWQQFTAITIPLLKPALFPAIILGSIWTFNMFNIIYLVSAGAPNQSTDILITEAYRWAFEQDRYGYAAAYSVLIFVILLGYSLVTSRVSRASEGAMD